MQIKLSEIAGGQLQAKANEAIREIVDNMLDPNMPWQPARTLKLELKFTQNEDRDNLAIKIDVRKKLADVKPITTQAYIGKDLDTGDICMEEYGSQVRGQMSMADMEQDENSGVVSFQKHYGS